MKSVSKSARGPVHRARLLVVDDHPVVREGLAALVHGEPDLELAWQAAGSREALRACELHSPDLAIVDLSLGEEWGIDLIRLLKARRPNMPILTLSVHDASKHAKEALRAGARGYITKQAAPRRLIEAIRELLAGGTYLPDADSQTASRPPDRATPLAALSERERDVFHCIGQGLAKGAIAARLGLSVNTVETHRTSIKKKLKVNSGSELARLAFLYSR